MKSSISRSAAWLIRPDKTMFSVVPYGQRDGHEEHLHEPVSACRFAPAEFVGMTGGRCGLRSNEEISDE